MEPEHDAPERLIQVDDAPRILPARRAVALPDGMLGFGKNAQGFEEFTNPRDGSAMVLVPAGKFTMGSEDGEPDERPAHKVHLDAYLIDQTPVTRGQYARFRDATGHAMPRPPDFQFDESHPVVNVSWEDAAAYCAWAGKRLPTEAEREKAARGTDGRRWPWGNKWDAKKTNAEGRRGGTTPVGAFPAGASPYGVLDMAGNVWNWCADWYGRDYYKEGANRNPRGPTGGRGRALRGGSWVNTQGLARCAYRSWNDPTYRNIYSGFRGARDL